MKRRQFSALAAAFVAAPAAFAQDRAIKVLVGFPPGGASDTLARVLADKMRVSLNQSVIVENKPGAAGRIALSELKRAAADGHTFAVVPSGAMVILPHLYKLDYDPVTDFTPVTRLVTLDFAVTVGPSVPAGDLKSVLAWMKANPANANYGTSGAGTVPHFVGVLLSQVTGVPLTHIAYRGGTTALQDLIAGQLPMMIDPPPALIEHHKSGRVRILAVTGERRLTAVPEVPTLKEVGINMTADAFIGLYGPPGLPADVVVRVDKAVLEAIRSPEVPEKIYSLGLVPAHAPAAQLATVQAEHLRKWEAPIKASGFKAE